MDINDATEEAYKNGYEQGYDDGYDDGYKLGKMDAVKWIPVTERLPDDGGCVLIALRWGYVDTGWYDKQFERWTSEFVNRYEDGEITHWMPLPEPPKGE